LKIIPVLDVLNGVAVHAVRGQREQYQPLKSVLCPSSKPMEVAFAFKSFGFDCLYLADLDAILGGSANYALYSRIKAKTNIDLMVDAGISEREKAEKVLEAGVSKMVIGTETLKDLAFVNESIKSFGKSRVIVSLDLKEGKLVSISESIRSMKPLNLAIDLERTGISTVIVLDLATVGTECGVNKSMIRDVLDKTELEVWVGGGMRGIKDLEELRNMGVSGALIATALHAGKLTAKELISWGFI